MRANIKSTCIKQVLFSTIKSFGFISFHPWISHRATARYFTLTTFSRLTAPHLPRYRSAPLPRGGRPYWGGEFCHAKLGERETKGEKNRRPMAASAAPKTHLYHEISVLEHILCRSHADSLLKKPAKMILI